MREQEEEGCKEGHKKRREAIGGEHPVFIQEHRAGRMEGGTYCTEGRRGGHRKRLQEGHWKGRKGGHRKRLKEGHSTDLRRDMKQDAVAVQQEDAHH